MNKLNLEKERKNLASILSEGRTDEEWGKEENFNNFKLVWDEKIKELEYHTVNILKAINRKNISEAFVQAERLKTTVE